MKFSAKRNSPYQTFIAGVPLSGIEFLCSKRIRVVSVIFPNGAGCFGLISKAGGFGPTGAGCFGLISKVGRLGSIFRVGRFGKIGKILG